MFHSTWVSEPLAQVFGLLVGVITYAVVGGDHQSRLLIAEVASVLTNLFLGAPVNVMSFDVLGLLVARPLSAAAGAAILRLVLS
jgi:hypothetical protein